MTMLRQQRSFMIVAVPVVRVFYSYRWSTVGCSTNGKIVELAFSPARYCPLSIAIVFLRTKEMR